MISQTPSEVLSTRELLFKQACEDMAADLRAINPASFVQLFEIGDGRAVHGEICEIVERHFPSGKMIFSCSGSTSISWNALPVVAIDLEFTDPPVFAFFRLVLKGETNLVELHIISFEQDTEGKTGDAIANTAHLAAALKSAACGSQV